MLISTKGRYGLKAAAYITRLSLMRPVGGAASAACIARGTGLPENYLEGILRSLKAAGIITAERGLKGGYRLAKPPCDITVGAVLRATEGDLAPAPCLSPDSGARICGNCEECDTRDAWEEIFEKLNGVLDSITLDKMIENRKM